MGHSQDLETLFHCCKAGKFATVKSLIAKGISVNVRDRWDSTPLYYACLCGHKAIVKLLLQSGASCNADTYDGERCLHGALTLDIRKMLKTFQVCSKNVLGRTTYHLFMSKLRKDRTYVDASVVTIDGIKIPYHECIISKAIETSHISERVSTRRNIGPEHISAAFDFIYTAVVDIQPLRDLSALYSLSEAFGIPELGDLVKNEHEKRIKMEHQHYAHKALAATIEGDFDVCRRRMEELYATVDTKSESSDIAITVNNEKTFYCHKCVVCLRSPYIESFIEFADKVEESKVHNLCLGSIKVAVFQEALRYIYTDNIHLVADMFLVPGMKNKVAKLLCNEISLENVIELIRMSRCFCVEELENQAVQFISRHLQQVIFTEAFKELVVDDANSIIDRQEVDSIDIIDAIRFHLHAAEDLAVVDKLLTELNLLA
ncbi:hypothetical protein QR680_002460 [Steinernema hermaphroditum]|uniref:BTB domain-containing protein n=1 Tax=Steinernema hermaphroditum TaxID=289476 RepID=A0AA39H2T8_9BILA|nr:hypothetical protein QR680_002460 [Steinernema hermaphroditum]